MQGVVISGGDGVELVIMATGTGKREAHKPFTHHINTVINNFVNVIIKTLANGKITKSGKISLIIDIDLISRNLFDYKVVERLVFIESTYDVIAISPRVRINWITTIASSSIAAGISVSRYI